MSLYKSIVNPVFLNCEVTNTDVVISTNCLKTYRAEDGVKLVVQVSEIGYKELVMALGDGHDVIKYIDGALDIANGCLMIGAFIFPASAPGLLALAGVGAAIQLFLHMIPDQRPDPAVLKLKELEKVIHEVQKLANEKFTDLKQFITESQFAVDIISEATVLMKLMRNCLIHQNEESVDNFRQVYKRRSSLRLAYILMSFLEQKSTNPLIMAMETDKSQNTFDKWEDIIKGLLGQLLIIEGFASGLIKNENAYNWDRMLERSNQVISIINDWREEYSFVDYWAEMHVFMATFIPSSTHLNNAEKADEIKKKLESYKTNDAFFICVFNEGQTDKNYNYDCETKRNQLIGCWNQGKCNAFIYRSRKANEMTDADYAESERRMNDCREGELKYYMGLSSVFTSGIVEKKFDKKGFLFVVDENCNPEVRYTFSTNHQSPPGSWGKVKVINGFDKKESRQCSIILAFP